jgi:adenosylcobinamide-phosphate synthase
VPFDPTPSALALVLALAWDALLGEPPAVAHPVVWMGRVTGALVARAPDDAPAAELAFGVALAAAVPLLFATGGAVLLAVAEPLPLARLLLETYLLKSAFALRALGDAARVVRDDLAAGDVPGARAHLSSLCSRDASALEPPDLAAAAVESVAENASDSFVAPLAFYVVLGLPGALLYRAVNTLDAMVGYRGRFERLGKASARLDDALNWAPARMTAALLRVAGWLDGADVRRAAYVLARDGARTASPNAGRPMAAMAGLLGVALAKPGCYSLGDPRRPVDGGTIDAAWRHARTACLVASVVALAAVGLRHAVAR